MANKPLFPRRKPPILIVLPTDPPLSDAEMAELFNTTYEGEVK